MRRHCHIAGACGALCVGVALIVILGPPLFADLLFILNTGFSPERHSCTYRRTSYGKPRVVVLVAYDDALGADLSFSSQDVQGSVANKEAYAAERGYDIRVEDFSKFTDRPGGWGKILMIQEALKSYDFVFYADVDTVVMNSSVHVEQMLPPDKDLAMTKDTSGVNTGAMVFRRSNWTLWFLEEVWRQAWLVHGDYPFHWDQRPFHYLLQTTKWKEQFGDSLPYPIEDKQLCDRIQCQEVDSADPRRNSTNIASHIQALPQCAMNSFLLWPFSKKNQDRLETAQYVPGDFLIHAAGYRSLVKAAVFRAALARSRSNKGVFLRGTEPARESDPTETPSVGTLATLLACLACLLLVFLNWMHTRRRRRLRRVVL